MRIALYYRLSMADGDLGKDNKEESNSIENQRLLLTAFVEAREDLDGEISEYIDDGYSGTNFERSSFKLMPEKSSKIFSKKVSSIIMQLYFFASYSSYLRLGRGAVFIIPNS